MRPICYGLFFPILACNAEGVFGGSEKSIPVPIDLLFVIDNSASMMPESKALGQSFERFLDAVDSDLDFQLGVTTSVVESGSGGSLLGDISVHGDADMQTIFKQQLFCDATSWDRDRLPRDADYACGEESTEVSVEYLDCLCDGGRWDGEGSSGSQEPLEAALLSLCRAVENPPESCFDAGTFSSNATGTESGFVREDSAVVIMVVGDSGDGSRRMDLGEEKPEIYLRAFEEFDRDIMFTAIGPNLTRETNAFICNTAGANYWMVERLYSMIDDTGGFYRPLEDKTSNNDCALNPFADHMDALADFLSTLSEG